MANSTGPQVDGSNLIHIILLPSQYRRWSIGSDAICGAVPRRTVGDGTTHHYQPAARPRSRSGRQAEPSRERSAARLRSGLVARHGFSLPPAHGPRLGQPYMKMRHFFGNSLASKSTARTSARLKKCTACAPHERTHATKASANETKAASVKAAHGLHPCTDSNSIVIVHASVQMSWRAPAQSTNGCREARRHNRQLLSPTIKHGQVNLSTCDAGVRHPIPRMR